MKVENAKTLPQRYYGLHFAEGVAEYQEPGSEPYRIFIGESTIKNMDPSFTGRPVYVQHVDKVDLANIQNDADGFVVRSFFNKADGKHWAEFIVVSDSGHEAIRKGWKLSNAYIPRDMGLGGQWHGVDYAKEVRSGEYEHLAIVPNPRYEESIILNPEQFKLYNSKKEAELATLTNSKGAPKMNFNFFKRTKVENSAELEGMSVTLPKSKKEVSLADLITNADSSMMPEHMCNEEHMVDMGEKGKMSVKALKDSFTSLSAEHEEMKKNMVSPAEKEADEADKDADKGPEGEKMNKDKDGEEKKPMDEEKKENEEDEDGKKKPEDKKMNEKQIADKVLADLDEAEGIVEPKDKTDHFSAIKNAPEKFLADKTPKIDLSEDKVARGKSRYGSN